MMRRREREHVEQVALFHWVDAMYAVMPELALLYAIPNGGARDVRTGAKLKREGVRAGMPDICWPVPRGGYGALYIEMKVGKNKPGRKQVAVMELLEKAGNRVVVCYDWQAAKEAILGYAGQSSSHNL